ncbi:hypothetical protein [Halohasta litorea]|uniref:Major facilitator superfamily (MFS) profile domain-containing protein n=1 Tax=Halohasta litorea TaxID=869891 RepID=A0ABD6DD96_9EURY|nr:hypothetical protein [Halohasta litorea]
MSDVGDGVEGVFAFIIGGFVLVMIGSAIESSSMLYDIGNYGLLMILLGVVLAVGVIATVIGGLLGR